MRKRIDSHENRAKGAVKAFDIETVLKNTKISLTDCFCEAPRDFFFLCLVFFTLLKNICPIGISEEKTYFYVVLFYFTHSDIIFRISCKFSVSLISSFRAFPMLKRANYFN
jgi:hypothetical protein